MIKINDRFYINADVNCYKLQEKTIIQDKESKNYGNEVFKDLGYYTTIESAIKGALKVELREFVSKDEVNTLKDVLNKIKKYKDYLKRVFEGE